MTKVKIKTLSPIHIGNGNKLLRNIDFVEQKDNLGDDYLMIFSPEKILELIGEENVQRWVNTIDTKQDILKFIRTHSNKTALKAYEYSKRGVYNYANSANELAELIHDGNGFPYIPGSSIKGAIRTALLSDWANNSKGLEKMIIPDRRGNLNSKLIEKECFAKSSNKNEVDPQKDFMKFLRVGDAFFEKGCEIALKMVMLNERHKEGLYDNKKSMIVEAIAMDESSTFSINIAEDAINYSLSKERGTVVNDNIRKYLSLDSVFKIVNSHTKKMIEEEIAIWHKYDKEDSFISDSYLSVLSDTILPEIEDCRGGIDCILRLGYGSGWRFMTGAWAEKLSNFKSVVVPKARKDAYKYEQYKFPKTRKIGEFDIDDDESFPDLMGFVKLSIIQ